MVSELISNQTGHKKKITLVDVNSILNVKIKWKVSYKIL